MYITYCYRTALDDEGGKDTCNTDWEKVLLRKYACRVMHLYKPRYRFYLMVVLSRTWYALPCWCIWCGHATAKKGRVRRRIC